MWTEAYHVSAVAVFSYLKAPESLFRPQIFIRMKCGVFIWSRTNKYCFIELVSALQRKLTMVCCWVNRNTSYNTHSRWWWLVVRVLRESSTGRSNEGDTINQLWKDPTKNCLLFGPLIRSK